MTPKEQAAMQQALEALEELFHSNSTKVAVEKYNIAHNALREALAEKDDGSVCGRCGGIVYDPVFKQAEQERYGYDGFGNRYVMKPKDKN